MTAVLTEQITTDTCSTSSFTRVSNCYSYTGYTEAIHNIVGTSSAVLQCTWTAGNDEGFTMRHSIAWCMVNPCIVALTPRWPLATTCNSLIIQLGHVTVFQPIMEQLTDGHTTT